jgi:hypothetical protein
MIYLLAFCFGLGVSLGWHHRYWISHMAGAVRYWILCPELADRDLQSIRDVFKGINQSIWRTRAEYPEWYVEYLAWRELGYSANPTSQINSPKPSARSRAA